jgi:spore coat polysaccharide biosynthesis protein SpsF (cytidylyltransferase family)
MIGCIIQARLGSTRLPGKVMLSVDGSNPLIYYVINQIKYSKLSEKIIIATTELTEDQIIVDFAKKNSIDFFRGSTENCLDRYYQCARSFSVSTIVRITCDNPLIDPTLIDDAIKKFNDGNYDYVSNCKPRSFPQGTEVEVFSFRALEKAWNEAKKPSETEHVTPYFYNNPDKFRIFNITNQENISNLRWTVDREQDLEFVRAIIRRIQRSPILMKDILEILKNEPEIADINKNYIMDEGYIKSLRDDNKYKYH